MILNRSKDLFIRYVAFFISLLFHPVFIPFYASIVYFLYSGNVFFDFEKIIRLIFIITILIPLLVYYILYIYGWISSFSLQTLNGRLIFLFFLTILYGVLALILGKNPYLYDLQIFFLGITVSLIWAQFFIIKEKIKISLHMMALGGAFIFFLMTSMEQKINMLPVFALIFILHFLVMASRLYLKAHDMREIFWGWMAGMGGMLSAYIISVSF